VLFGAGAWLSGLDRLAPWLPFLLSIPFFGLSHGGADWMLLRPRSRAQAWRVFLVYALAGAALAVFAVGFPALAISGFALLSIAHFGIADERDLRVFGGGIAARRWLRFGGVARMGVFLGLICVLDPDGVAAIYGRVLALLGHPGDPDAAAWIGEAAPILLIGALLAWGASLGPLLWQALGAARDGAARGRAGVEVGEAILLFGAAALFEPVFAVGLYFFCWHAWRHCWLVTERAGVGGGRLAKLASLHARSWPLSIPAFVGMVALVGWRGSFASPLDWVASLLVVCIVFTLPHHFIVERWVARQGADRELPDVEGGTEREARLVGEQLLR